MSSFGGVPAVAPQSRVRHRCAVICLCITLPVAFSSRDHAQQVPSKAPLSKAPANNTGTPSQPIDATHPEDSTSQPGTTTAPGRALPEQAPALAVGTGLSSSTADAASLPDDPAFPQAAYPIAEPLPSGNAEHVAIDALKQSRSGGHVVLDGSVVMTYGAYRVEADHVDYDEATGVLEATGHLRMHGSKASELVMASRGSMNLRNETGTFYDVSGSVGMRTSTNGRIYTVGNPFLFSGRKVVKNGPADFEIYDGTVTSCQLPDPDWRLSSAKFVVHEGKASAHGTVFRLRNIPILYLPYVTHPVPEEGADQRQSGLMIPVIGQSSTKGLVLGEQIYLALNRSMDLTVGAEYFSKRGYQQSATFRYKGRDLDFLNAHFSNLLDRGFTGAILTAGPGGSIVSKTGYINQGGEDITVAGRKDLSPHARLAADAEYLSKYAYRQAFTDTFNQAVATDIVSTVYGTYQNNGFAAAVEGDRYQGLKRTITGEQVRILHLPQLDLDSAERHIGRSPLLWNGMLQSSAIKRTQGTDSNASQLNTGFVERLDFKQQVSLPLSFAGFKLRPTTGVRNTWYSKSRDAAPLPGALPVERDASLNRTTFETDVELRAPVLERVFEGGPFSRLLGRAVKHTIEPEAHYHYVTGVDDFNRTLRFDASDVVSNTNEMEYGITQRLFLRPTKLRPCEEGEVPVDTSVEAKPQGRTSLAGTGITAGPLTSAANDEEDTPTCGGTRESLRWRIVQRYYLNDTFGKNVLVARPGVVVRNVLENTLDLSGVAFLTGQPRSLSPIVSEMRLSATSHLDAEWDMNYDTVLEKFTQSNIFVNYHAGASFAGVSYARLNAPGRFQRLDTSTTGNTTSQLSDFSQLRLLLGYGTPTKQGFSVATNVGLDLSIPQPQYGALQMAYNWNCCGISGEYRKFELGSVRNENAYRFNFTLANIGSAGNLRRAERLF